MEANEKGETLHHSVVYKVNPAVGSAVCMSAYQAKRSFKVGDHFYLNLQPYIQQSTTRRVFHISKWKLAVVPTTVATSPLPDQVGEQDDILVAALTLRPRLV